MKPRRYTITRSKKRYAKRKARVTKSNPNAKPVFNKQGGIVPASTFDLVKARAADLGTLPNGMCGTRCDLCSHYVKKTAHTGWCKHTLVTQLVSDRQCCIYWTNKNWLRSTKVAK